MENFKFETQGTNTYVVYTIDDSEMLDSMTLGMITNNKIAGFAQAFFLQQDNVKYIKYNISSKVSAEQFLMGNVSKKRIIGVFKGIVNAMISAEEYMIDFSSLYLDLGYIYTDVTTCETVVICLPVSDVDKEVIDLKAFFKNIVFSTQFDPSENGDYIAKLINYLNSASVFSVYDFKEILDEIERGTTSHAVSQPASRPATKTTSQSTPQPARQTVSQPAVQPVSQLVAQPVSQLAQQQQSTPQTVKKQEEPKQKIVMPKATESTSVNVGFAVPTKQNTNMPTKKEEIHSESSVGEKEISWLYLMQHYNKENAALYKAQQDAKKAAKTTSTPDKKEKKGKVPTPAVPNTSFAIPGQQAEAPKPMTSTPVAPAPATKPAHIPVQSAPQVSPTPQPATYAPPQQIPQPTGMPANFGETTVLSVAGCGETTVLGVAPVKQDITPYLIRRKNNEKIILNKPVFRVGKERSYVDYFIGDNTAISRSHANIITREGTYFVVDTNSTNHTFINGNMINSNEEVQINHGDSIRFANEDFEFKLY